MKQQSTIRKVIWNDLAWRQFAELLHATNPQFDFMRSPTLAGVTVARLNEAGAKMPKGLRRQFGHTSQVKPRLKEIYAGLLNKCGPDYLKPDVPTLELTATGRAPRKNVMWREAEWELVAAELLRRFPQATWRDDPTLASLQSVDILAAQEAVLPPERQRDRAALYKMHGIRPMLAPVIAAIKERQAQHSAKTNIMWTKEEWEQVAAALRHRHASRDWLTDPELIGLSSTDMIDAQSVLPPERRRSRSSLSVLVYCRQGIKAAFARLDAKAAARPAVQAVCAEAAAQPELPLVPAPSKDEDKRWSKYDYRLIAWELMRQHPHTNFLSQKGLYSITAADLQAAQHVLRPERRRATTSPRRLALDRPNLQRAFANNKGELINATPEMLAARTPAAAAPQESAAPQAVQELVREVAPAIAREVTREITREVVTARETIREVAAPAAANPWEQAMQPMVNLMAQQLGAGLAEVLAPALAAALAPAMSAALEQSLHPVIDAAVAKLAAAVPAIPAPQRDYPFLPPQRPKPTPAQLEGPIAQKIAQENKPEPKPLIGVVGPLPAQQRVLEAAYPNLELRFIESGQARVKENMNSCVRVIGMTSFLNHPIDGALRKMFGERYCRVTGGVSAIKQQINAWMATGALSERRVVAR